MAASYRSSVFRCQSCQQAFSWYLLPSLAELQTHNFCFKATFIPGSVFLLFLSNTKLKRVLLDQDDEAEKSLSSVSGKTHSC